MTKSHGLGQLQMGETGHDGIKTHLGLIEQCRLQFLQFKIMPLQRSAHPEAERGRYLIVAGTGSVQPPRRLADNLLEAGLQIHVNVFIFVAEGESPFLQLGLNLVKALENGRYIGFGQNPAGPQHGGMSAVNRDIFGRKFFVKPDGNVDMLHDGCRSRRKTSAPHNVGLKPGLGHMNKPSLTKTLTRRHWLTGFSILAASVKAFPAAAANGSHGLENYRETTPPRKVPDISFSYGGSDSNIRHLSEFSGRVILLNIWATWCPSCVLEMPALDRLQGQRGGADFMVLPISIDRGGSSVVQEFYANNAIKNLPLAIDNSLAITRKINPRGLPFTLLINRRGEEVGSSLGDEEWDGPAALALIMSLINET